MADPRVSGHSCWKQSQVDEITNNCFSKKILLLLVWQALFILSLIPYVPFSNAINIVSEFLSYFSAPLIGWLADVKFGRYEVIKFGSISSFLAGIFYYFAILTVSTPWLGTVLFSLALVTVSFGSICYTAAMLPFLTDQIIGATSDELSAVVRWYYWALNFGLSLSNIIASFCSTSNSEKVHISFIFIFAVPLALIIISDCSCQQWLDRTHKVTNPIKLIIQVLNYTRKHSYPERRSAFTYIDEEQPKRVDYGKEKFGGPFTEEEVEDVKTFSRLLPLIICLSVSVTVLENSPKVLLFDDDDRILVLNRGIKF